MPQNKRMQRTRRGVEADAPAEALESKITYALCLELAAKIRPADKVLSDHGIEVTEWPLLKSHPYFLQRMREATKYWNSTDNSVDRIRAVSGAMTEEALLPVFQIAHDPDAHPSARLDAVKLLAKLSGAEPQAKSAFGGGGSGEKFTININLGDEDKDKSVTIDATPQLPTDEGTDE